MKSKDKFGFVNKEQLKFKILILLFLLNSVLFFSINELRAAPAGSLDSTIVDFLFFDHRAPDRWKQCPDLSNEDHLPYLERNALHWVCYAATDTSYLLSAWGHGVIKNWVSANQAAYDELVGKVMNWDATQKDDLEKTIGDLEEAERLLLLNYIKRLAISRYVKDSTNMNRFLWAADRLTIAEGEAVNTTEYKYALRLWSVKALEEAIASQPRQATHVFRGKAVRSPLIQIREQFQNGSLIWEPAFVSTTKSRSIALGYTNVGAEASILFKIVTSQSGGDLEINQREITMPPNTVFRVVGDPEFLVDHSEEYEGNGFVNNGCIGEGCRATWRNLVVVTLMEDRDGKTRLDAAEQEVQRICQQSDTFIMQCGRHNFVKQARNISNKISRKFAGARIGDCSYRGRRYSCSTRSGDQACRVCVLCLNSSGKVKTRSTTLRDWACTGRGASADGLYFLAEDD